MIAGAVVAGCSSEKMPALFMAHGSPYLLDDVQWRAELAAWGQALRKPKAILSISAHWIDAPVTLSATRQVPLVYDYYGFPERYYDVRYAAPTAPDLAARLTKMLPNVRSSDRGLDHGTYMPLLSMYPKADIPILQMSIPTFDIAELVKLGQSLAPLRDEGVLIIGSGFLTHNMRAFSDTTPAWATEFDAWTAEIVAKRDVDALARYRELAPGVKMALPTHEHFVPVAVALGAALESNVTFPITGFTYGSFTKRSVQFG